MRLILDSSTGIWVTLITLAASGVGFLLVYIAQAIFKSGNFNVEYRRHAFIDSRDVHLELQFENITTKDRVYSLFDLYGMKEGKPILLAHLSGIPLSNDFKNSFIFRCGNTYSVSIPASKKRKISVSYFIPSEVDLSSIERYFLLVKDGMNFYQVAYFANFSSTSSSELHFRIKLGAKKKFNISDNKKKESKI